MSAIINIVVVYVFFFNLFCGLLITTSYNYCWGITHTLVHLHAATGFPILATQWIEEESSMNIRKVISKMMILFVICAMMKE